MQTVEETGFPQDWVSWIVALSCMSHIPYSLMERCRVKSSRRVGSEKETPCLHIYSFYARRYSRAYAKKPSNEGSLPRGKAGRYCSLINHLLFANDTMFWQIGPGYYLSSNFQSPLLQEGIATMHKQKKSAITFSSKISLKTKTRVKKDLNISCEGGIGKYLALPSILDDESGGDLY